VAWRAQQDDRGQQVDLDERPQVGVEAVPGARRHRAYLDQVEDEREPLVQRRVRGPPGRQRGDREQGQDGQFGEPQVVLLELVQVEIPEVVHYRLDRGDERRPGVLAPVDQQREAADGQLHHDLPHHEGHGRNGPGQVVTSGPHRAPAPDGADDLDDGHGGHRDQH
jgi:hypothetical protein